MKWWLVAVYLARMDAYGTDSMEQCHAILASAERNEFRLLPQQLVNNLQVEGAVDLACLDNDTVVQLAQGTFGNLPKNFGPDLPRLPASNPRALRSLPPEGTDGPDDRQSDTDDPELSPNTTPEPKRLAPLPYPQQPPSWKVLPQAPKAPPIEAYNRALASKDKPSFGPAVSLPLPTMRSTTVIDEWGNPIWIEEK